MTWTIAITIIFTLPVLLAFALFLIVYFAESRREKQLIKDYQMQIDKGAAALKDMRIVYETPAPKPKQTAKPADPIPEPDDKKKSINFFFFFFFFWDNYNQGCSYFQYPGLRSVVVDTYKFQLGHMRMGYSHTDNEKRQTSYTVICDTSSIWTEITCYHQKWYRDMLWEPTPRYFSIWEPEIPIVLKCLLPATTIQDDVEKLLLLL